MPPRTTTRRAVLAVASLLATTHAALAHAVLVHSTPAQGATIPAGTTHIELRFNSLIDAGRSWLVLVHGKQETKLAVTSGEGADILSGRAEFPPGPCVLRWQVLARDGHITRSQITFTVQPNAAGR